MNAARARACTCTSVRAGSYAWEVSLLLTPHFRPHSHTQISHIRSPPAHFKPNRCHLLSIWSPVNPLPLPKRRQRSIKRYPILSNWPGLVTMCVAVAT